MVGHPLGENVRVFPGSGLPALELLAAIIETSNDAIISKDLNGTILSWNEGAERLFGYLAEEMLGRPITVLIPNDRLNEEHIILGRIRRGERVAHYETVRQRKDGSTVAVSISVSPIRDGNGQVVGASKIARNITKQKYAEEQQQLVIGELKHRARNFAAIIDAIANQSRPKNAPEAEAVLNGFVARLRALLVAGELVTGSSAQCVSLSQLFDRILQPFVDPKRPQQIRVAGSHIEVAEQTAGYLALAVHELATNALKYGALGVPQGKVTLEWSLTDTNYLVVDWKEQGATSNVVPPLRTGFGSRMIKTAVAREKQGKTTLNFDPDGVKCRFEFQIG